MHLYTRLAEELSVDLKQIEATVNLLDAGSSVPFIARYRKEITGELDDTQLRLLEQRLGYLRELAQRQKTILKSIEEQGKLSPDLEAKILAADNKTLLEDLYTPYKPKRRSKALQAKEAGLEPLALGLWQQGDQDPETFAVSFINPDKGIQDVKAALEGARAILMECFSEDAALLGELREHVWDNAHFVAHVIPGQENAGAKFSDYFDYQEALKKIPSHRALALFRGRNEKVLLTQIKTPDDLAEIKTAGYEERRIAAHFCINKQTTALAWLKTVVRWTWRVKLRSQIEIALLNRLRENAEADAIQVFADNLKDLLLAAPAGEKATIGLDPGLRTGVKVAVVDKTGKVLEHGVIYPHAPKNQWSQSIAMLAALAQKHQVKLISIGNGTASRETDKLVIDLQKQFPKLHLQKLVVSEAGASVYSASELAAQEFPDLDVTIRGAVSIARRLQDPLAELVKIEAKAIGVGQYQHDINQVQLAQKLDAVVEDCVNAVGVDVNTASAPLLTKVSGLNRNLAQNIINYRDQNGAFSNRKQLLKVPRLGAKAFEQAAGFLRIMNGENPLDKSAVHPESYPLVQQIVDKTGKPIVQILNNSRLLNSLNAGDYIDDRFGLPTIEDILLELDKPGRDPRPAFQTASFKEGVETLQDLRENMQLEGIVTNVTHFGAFVDIGVHQDGLVHISALADRFVSDPRDVVKAGDIVSVKVLEIDIPRRRVALSMKSGDDARNYTPAKAPRDKPQRRHTSSKPEPSPQGGSMAAAFARAGRK